MTMDKIINDFFNFDAPCPPEIPMCEKVRQAYQDELSKATTEGCTQCAKNGIKAKFMEAVWKEATSYITSKSS